MNFMHIKELFLEVVQYIEPIYYKPFLCLSKQHKKWLALSNLWTLYSNKFKLKVNAKYLCSLLKDNPIYMMNISLKGYSDEYYIFRFNNIKFISIFKLKNMLDPKVKHKHIKKIRKLVCIMDENYTMISDVNTKELKNIRKKLKFLKYIDPNLLDKIYVAPWCHSWDTLIYNVENDKHFIKIPSVVNYRKIGPYDFDFHNPYTIEDYTGSYPYESEEHLCNQDDLFDMFINNNIPDNYLLKKFNNKYDFNDKTITISDTENYNYDCGITFITSTNLVLDLDIKQIDWINKKMKEFEIGCALRYNLKNNTNNYDKKFILKKILDEYSVINKYVKNDQIDKLKYDLYSNMGPGAEYHYILGLAFHKETQYTKYGDLRGCNFVNYNYPHNRINDSPLYKYNEWKFFATLASRLKVDPNYLMELTKKISIITTTLNNYDD